jgi:hypothetical protein
MQSKWKKYALLLALLAIVLPLNYYLFKDTPNVVVEKEEEAVIKEVTGIDIDFTTIP